MTRGQVRYTKRVGGVAIGFGRADEPGERPAALVPVLEPNLDRKGRLICSQRSVPAEEGSPEWAAARRLPQGREGLCAGCLAPQRLTLFRGRVRPHEPAAPAWTHCPQCGRAYERPGYVPAPCWTCRSTNVTGWADEQLDARAVIRAARQAARGARRTSSGRILRDVSTPTPTPTSTRGPRRR